MKSRIWKRFWRGVISIAPAALEFAFNGTPYSAIAAPFILAFGKYLREKGYINIPI